MMISSLLLIGGVTFWAAVIISFILMLFFINGEDEGNGLSATITIIISAILFFYFIKIPVKQYIKPEIIIPFICCYLIIGVLWSFAKWFLFLVKKRYALEGKKLKEYSRYDIPLVKDNKDKIILWMVYWPWSAIWTIINDPVRRFFDFVYMRISGLYQKISDRIFKDVISYVKENEYAKKEDI